MLDLLEMTSGILEKFVKSVAKELHLLLKIYTVNVDIFWCKIFVDF